MEVIEYAPPTSWSDKGMNWEKPDPANIDYAVALREAIIERAILVKRKINDALLAIMPCRPLSAAAMSALREEINMLAPSFVNQEFTDYKEDLSDFPKMWTYSDLIDAEDCRVCEHPGVGSTTDKWSEWFTFMRNVINKLTMVNFTGICGTALSRSAARHDPPFSESISTVMREVMEGDPRKDTFYSFPQEFYAWSGNTDYKKDRDGKNGYCGYAQSRSLVIQKALKPHPTAECDLIFRFKVSKPLNPVPYSQELQSSTLDLAGSGLTEGITTLVTHWSNDMELDIRLGNVDSIPRNSTVPSSKYKSNYDSDGNFSGYSREIGRSAKTGYEGTAYCVLDFGVEKGFKFQANS